jgi:hypothetical protein
VQNNSYRSHPHSLEHISKYNLTPALDLNSYLHFILHEERALTSRAVKFELETESKEILGGVAVGKNVLPLTSI